MKLGNVVKLLNDAYDLDGVTPKGLLIMCRTMYMMGENPLSIMRKYLQKYSIAVGLHYIEAKSQITDEELRTRLGDRKFPVMIMLAEKRFGIVVSLKWLYVTNTTIFPLCFITEENNG